MNIIIIDDESKARAVLVKMLSKINTPTQVIGEADSVESGLKLLLSKTPDVLFLDIRMEDGTGFTLLDKLNNINFNIVFVTAYEEYSIKAFKYNAIDYLLKPILLDDLEKVITRINNNNKQFIGIDQIRKLILETLNNKTPKNQVTFQNKTSIEVVEVEDIIRCEASSNYTYIYLSNGTRIIASKTLKNIESQLSEYNFIRIHHSHLINASLIKHFDKEGIITLHDGSKLPVSRRKRNKILEWFFKL